jgi:hypothetical protein
MLLEGSSTSQKSAGTSYFQEELAYLNTIPQPKSENLAKIEQK